MVVLLVMIQFFYCTNTCLEIAPGAGRKGARPPETNTESKGEGVATRQRHFGANSGQDGDIDDSCP